MRANLLKRAIPAGMATWSEEKREQIEIKYKKTAYIVALMEYIVSQLPSTFCDGTKLGGGERRVQWYKKAFPHGLITFTVPSAGREKNKLPDPMYELIEGTQIHLTHWDLNAPNYAIPCLKCKDGLLKKVRFHKGKLMSAMTLVFDTYGPTGYKMGGYYYCNSESCKFRVKSMDGGKLLRALPGWLTKSFPVHPKWVNPSGYFHLAQSASRFLEQAMLTQGSAKWVSEMMYENPNKYYKEKEAVYYSGEIAGAIFADFPSLKEWRGPFPPSPYQMLELAEKAAKSMNMLSGVCDDERNKREIQGMGSTKSSVINHTFSALSKYQSLLGAKAIFCQGVDGGQVSSVVLVDSTAINQASHAIKQCAPRPNFRLFIISSDTLISSNSSHSKIHQGKGRHSVIFQVLATFGFQPLN
jgi:hypothetical protein